MNHSSCSLAKCQPIHWANDYIGIAWDREDGKAVKVVHLLHGDDGKGMLKRFPVTGEKFWCLTPEWVEMPSKKRGNQAPR
jgi:hypothetical protein